MVINLKYHSFPMTQQTLIASIEYTILQIFQV